MRHTWWRHEVGVVESAAVLGIRDDCVVLLSTTTEVVLLEITRHLIEAIPATYLDLAVA